MNQSGGSENHIITLEEAMRLTANYRKAGYLGKLSNQLPTGLINLDAQNINTGEVMALHFGKEVIQNVLDQNGCMGIRIYYGLRDDGSNALIIVGVNENQTDMCDGLILDKGGACPSECSTLGSPLDGQQ